MIPDKAHLTYLFHRYLQDTISDGELDELFEYIRKSEKNELLKEEMMRVFYEAKEGSEAETVDWDNMFSTIIDGSEELRRTLDRSSIRWSSWYKVAAAAILLLLGTIGGYYYFSNRNNQVISPDLVEADAPQKNDIRPGGNKALLTLSNGSTIVLDSAQTGLLTGQGNMNLLKGKGTLAYQNQSPEEEQAHEIIYNTLTTPRGGEYELTLSDDTKVWLNSASSIKYPIAFTGKNREVEITGEVYFEVEHDKKRPFIVHYPLPSKGSREGSIEVLGTHFNVKAYVDEPVATTTLLEGVIRMENSILKPGEQASVNGDGELHISKNVDVSNAIAWKDGFFAFNNASLRTVMQDLSRWYDIDVRYEPGVDNGQQFSGRIDRHLTLNQILNGLKQTKAHFKIETDRKVIILP